MALEVVQAQAEHASLESTGICLHLADEWLASQYGGPPKPSTPSSL